MQMRRFDLLCLISFVCFVFTGALVGLSSATNPNDNHISFTHSFHVGVGDARIMFFNDADYGPYSGSIINLGDAEGNVMFKGDIRARTVLDRFWHLWEYGLVMRRYVSQMAPLWSRILFATCREFTTVISRALIGPFGR